MTHQEEKELRLLLSDLLDGDLSEARRARLAEKLRHDEVARRIYARHMRLHAQLYQDYVNGAVGSAMPDLANMPGPAGSPQRRPPTRLKMGWKLGLAAAAVVALFVNGVALLWRGKGETVADWSQDRLESVAVLTHAVHAKWDGAHYAVGEELPPGRLRLTAGMAQVEFFNGATVVMEAPAELELKAPDRAFLHSGRLRAFVPEPARGFTIESQGMRTVDLGTEFGLSVDPSGRSEWHVLDGEVELFPAAQSAGGNRVTSGQGIRMDQAGGPMEQIAIRPAEFVSREQIHQESSGRSQAQFAEWSRESQRLRTQPGLLTYFAFEGHSRWERQLRNESGGSNGAIVGAHWTQGRWPDKGALEFKRISDRIRVQVPGEFDELTLTAWVRIEGLDQWLSSLMLTDGFDPGEPHWQLSDKGELILGIGHAEPTNSFSAPVIGPRDLGRWIQLAVTISAIESRVIHYLDGKQLSEHSVKVGGPLRIGAAEIGNWRPADHNHSIRSLNGRIDELMIWSRALTADEIRELYVTGNPYR